MRVCADDESDPFAEDRKIKLFDKEKIKVVKLKLRNGSTIEVKELGEDYYGTWENRPVTCPVYSFDAIKWLADEMKFAIANKWDQVCATGGREGSGKSSFTLHLLDQIAPDYPLEKLTFTQKDFRDAVFNAKFYDTVVMDEGGEAMLAQEWYEKAQRDLVKAFLRFRIKKLKVLINLPHLMLLNKQLRERRVHWWFEVYARDWDKRGWVQIRRAPIKQDPFKTDIFWRGAFTIGFPSYESVHPKRWKEYEKIKVECLEKADKEMRMEGERDTSKANVTRERMRNAMQRLHERGMKIGDIADLFGVSTRTVHEYINRGRKY